MQPDIQQAALQPPIPAQAAPQGAAEAAAPAKPPLMSRAFLLLWLSETAFDIGAALMGFALGVWVFEKTGSAEQFSWTILSAAVPALLMTPFSGALADRFDRRWVIASCDVLAALLVGVLALLHFRGELSVVHLYVFNGVGAVIGALRNPSYMAAIGAIVPKDNLTQANGVVNFTQAIMHIGAPLAAGYLMASHGLGGIMVVEVLLVAAGAIAIFGALSSAKHAIRGSDKPREGHIFRTMLESFSSAIGYFKTEPLMVGLLAYAVLQESLMVLITAMITPLVLSTHNSDALGLVLTAGAFGGMVGSALLVILKIKTRLMAWVLGTDACLSLAVVWAGFTDTTAIWCLCAFIAMMAGAASGSCAGALWMRKTPSDKQGSIFALIGALHLLALCAVMSFGGTVGQRVFEPALMPGGEWAESIGTWVGLGKGRGYGFLFIVCGGVCATASLLALLNGRMRRLDDLVGDKSEPPAAADAPLPASVVTT